MPDRRNIACYRLSVRVLALDYGERRIGVAVTDPARTLAQPLETVVCAAAGEAHLERIAALVREYEVSEIVVGLPLHMDGRSGPEAGAARRRHFELRQLISSTVSQYGA